MLTLLFFLVFTACGLFLTDWLLSRQPLLRRIWLGLAAGLFLWTWLPSLFSFALGFTLLSNLLALGTAVILLVVSIVFNRHRFSRLCVRGDTVRNLLLLVPILAVGCYLFHTHVLLPQNGAYYVGQTTYGDLSMHLGFITSIARQGVFPPEYSIFPGHTVNYPFLCEVSSSSLLVLGADLRTAYLIPAVYAFVLVVLGVYFFFEQWLKRRNRALLATLLFFVGGGFGFAYFLDLAGNGYSLLSSTITDMQAGTSLQYLLDGFYHTPTNLPALGLRWVNPIVDMLIPQRATLFGWAFLFPCLYLLYGFVFRKEKANVLPLAVLAGGLPLIHTHSYLALAVISAGYCGMDLIQNRAKERLPQWLLYGGIAFVLGIFQLIPFAFAQASESGMLELHFNWCNTSDSFLWFYLKNLGFIAILTPVAFLCLSKQTRRVCVGPLILWILAECVVFQPNTYDNNKLLFICFAFACGLVARLLCYGWRKANALLQKRCSVSSQSRALSAGMLALNAACAVVLAYASARMTDGLAQMTTATVGFLLLMNFLTIFFALYLLIHPIPWRRCAVFAQVLLSAVTSCFLAIALLEQYTSAVIRLPRITLLLMLIGYVMCMSLSIPGLLCADGHKATGFAWTRLAMQTGACLLIVCLFLSGVMTLMREVKSKYMAFDRNQIAVAEYVDQNIEQDAVFLTDYSWHLNPISVLTGRSIVCGPGLYLYYHGIDTAERQENVVQMLEQPARSRELFEKYSVSYVYVGATENANYAVDTAYFASECVCVYDKDGIRIYRIGE